MLESIDVRDGAHELGEILAVARGVIKRVEARIQGWLRKRYAARVCSACKDDFVPLDGGNLVIEKRHSATTEKRARRFRRIKDRGLDLGYDIPDRSIAARDRSTRVFPLPAMRPARTSWPPNQRDLVLTLRHAPDR